MFDFYVQNILQECQPKQNSDVLELNYQIKHSYAAAIVFALLSSTTFEQGMLKAESILLHDVSQF